MIEISLNRRVSDIFKPKRGECCHGDTVRQLLQGKGYEVASIEPDKSVYDAMQLMAARNIGALLVLQDGKLAGIFTERDYSRKAYLLDRLRKIFGSANS